MADAPRQAARGGALRAARRAWQLLHRDAAAAWRAATRAQAQARSAGDREAQAWARLSLGFHHLYFGTPAEASEALSAAEADFVALGERAGQILAAAGIGRAMWRSGRVDDALAHLLPLRGEGAQLLRHEQRGVLLNAIAGCYSALGDSSQAIAYLHEALRDAGPRRGHGFDAALYCNLGHELMQLGDHEQALEQAALGLARCETLKNLRLLATLLVNRITSLVELGRAEEAWPDVQRLLAVPIGPQGRGTTALGFETLAMAALRSGRAEEGRELLARAEAVGYTRSPDEQVELAIARALLARHERGVPGALDELAQASAWADGTRTPRASLRARWLISQLACELHEAAGDTAAAVVELRGLVNLGAERARLAAAARSQAVLLQGELLRLRHRLEENDAKRRATERARAELAATNEALSRKIVEVEALQAALREQATQDALTGLFNRRHLNDTLPAMLALARREGHALAAVVIDLDHFKGVNDLHGHDAGDRLLAEFGRLLREELRRSDLAFRYGGEEFCVLMPHTPAAAAAAKVGELLRRWQGMSFVLAAATLHGQSFSAGVADSGEVPGGPAALLKAADERLLQAKRRGRARVLAADRVPAGE